jgi:hypothetical protein
MWFLPVQLLPDGEGNADGSQVSAEPDGAGHRPPHLLRHEHGEVPLSDPTHHLRGLKGTWLLSYTCKPWVFPFTQPIVLVITVLLYCIISKTRASSFQSGL